MKILLPLLAILLEGMAATAQTAVDFKSHFEPNTLYHQTQHQVMRMRFNFDSSSQEVRARLDSARPAGLDAKTAVIHLDANMTTGTIDKATGRMPVKLEVINLSSADTPTAQPFRIILGTVAPDSLPVFDSVVTDVQDKAFKNQFLQSMNGMFGQIHLPNTRIAKGQSYTYSTPLSIPVGASAVRMKLEATYRLLDVVAGVAHFSQKTRIVMDLAGAPSVGLPVSGSGTGEGTLDYDVHGQYIRGMQLTYDIDFGLHQGPLILHILISTDMRSTEEAGPAPKN